MKIKILFTSLMIGFLVFSCGKDTRPKRQNLRPVRVLALKADAPEVSGGATVNITPLISDYGATTRTLSEVLEQCTDPGVSYGAAVSCAHDPNRVTSAARSFSLASPFFTEARPVFTITIPTTVLAGKNPLELLNGVAYLLIYKLTAPEGTTETALKRIVVSTRAVIQQNRNPTLVQILADGAATSAAPGTQATLKAEVSGGSAEPYSVISYSGTVINKTEKLTISWFTTDGILSRGTTDENGEVYYHPPTTNNGLIVAVLRDDRGGVDWLLRQ